MKKQKIEAYTTKEINLLFNDETITSIFKNIDAVLYGNQNITTEIEYSKKQLTDFAFKQLNIKIDEINAGGK